MLLDARDVTREFLRPGGGEPVRVLRGVSLKLKAGDSVAVIGPSGSGKSTLLNLLGGLDRPDGGIVAVAGQDLAALSETVLAQVRNREVGFVFQLHHLLPQCTVLENVLVPTIPWARGDQSIEARQRALSLLERVGLADRLDHCPGRLSGGECQRVAVARALINRPRLLLADEPTGSLDAHTAEELGLLLAELNRTEKTALVVATHSRPLARLMDRVYALEDGMLNERYETD